MERAEAPVYLQAASRTLNPLFKVLFNFPSRYLFAIGLSLYLALDGVYHPLRAALPSNLTLGIGPMWTFGQTITGLAPSLASAPFTETLGSAAGPRPCQTPHFPLTVNVSGFSAGLFQFHSPLLKESFLVSFPPLTDMLKFRGSSHPNRDLMFRKAFSLSLIHICRESEWQ